MLLVGGIGAYILEEYRFNVLEGKAPAYYCSRILMLFFYLTEDRFLNMTVTEKHCISETGILFLFCKNL
jgi:hypothetical protein